jgi:hypothetical protein
METLTKKEQNKYKITVIGEVYETYNYEMFKTLEGNRDTNNSHIQKLIKSMEEIYIISPIIINSDLCIIDGQHRFESAKELGLPIRYIIDKNADLRAVQLLNAKSKDWSPNDYMESYIKLGNQEYIEYKKFLKRYKFTHQVCQSLLCGVASGTELFNNGDFKITQYKFAERVADFTLDSLEYYEGSKRRSYIYAITSLMKNKNFKEIEFLRKLKKQRSKMYDCAKTSQYIDLIEDIYNYRNKNKVNLRF